ncbi:DUF1652 domain-containing protein [Pseudomonas purpurea]|uniref:DUF1652 domain-containing protein n=1 Tax=Pseudomonas purpurea TaxID=3136737 RepID=UPI0032666780
MFAIHELCRTIESGFAPLSCTCTVNADGLLMINVFDPITGRVDLLLTGVSTAKLTNSRAIANLIGELRTEIRAGRRAFAGGLSDCAG